MPPGSTALRTLIIVYALRQTLFFAGVVALLAALVQPATPVNAEVRFSHAAGTYSNPFNSGTTITYGLPEGGPVELVVYDVLGRVVDRLVQETRQAGEHRVYWDASARASGVYVYRITTRSGTRSKSMMLVR